MHPVVELTVQDYLSREERQQGVCLFCGAWAPEIDPAVARAVCRVCGRPGVHGVDQALLRGFLRIQP